MAKSNTCKKLEYTSRITDDGYHLIREFEGFNSTPYLSSQRIWCIGYGHNRTVRAGMTINEITADVLLNDDLCLYGKVVSRLVTVPLTDNQFTALACFIYNVGMANFERCNFLPLLNRGWYSQVPAQLMKWSKMDGKELGTLWRRRHAEGRLWSK